jgi:hypothetical protein
MRWADRIQPISSQEEEEKIKSSLFYMYHSR